MSIYKMNKITKYLVIFLSSLSASSCQLGPSAYEIRGNADPVLNPDYSGKSLSVVVRVYQLKTADEFSKLTFDMVAGGRSDSELFGQALIAKTDAIVVPGKPYNAPDTLTGDAKYVGVVALFRTPDQNYWRYLISADEVRSHGLNFTVKDCYILLNGTKPQAIPGQPLDAKTSCPQTGNLGRKNTTSDNTPSGKSKPRASYQPRISPASTTNTSNSTGNGGFILTNTSR